MNKPEAMIQMKMRTALAWVLMAAMGLMILASPCVTASLCQTIRTSTNYPQSASPSQVVSFTTTVAGSCTSDGEDYFGVRVDLIDSTSGMVLSSNSTAIGYNANNFSVNVHNAATSPKYNQSWAINVNTYLIQAGAASGKYLLNSTAIIIQVGANPLPEFQPAPLFIIVLALVGSVLPKRTRPKEEKQPV